MSSIFRPRAEQASHWYHPATGKPCHEVPYKDKKRAGEMRPTTLKDARELGLVPSVTNLLNIIANPALLNWKIQQVLLASMTLPRNNGESEEDYVERIIKDSEAYTAKTADIGARIHDAVDNYLTHGNDTSTPDIAPQCHRVYDWIEANVSHVSANEEVIIGNGFAGRVDLIAGLKGLSGEFILDFKTRSPYKGALTARKSDLWQLCGYRLGYGDPRVGVASLLINRDAPTDPEATVWQANDMASATLVFKSARAIWYANNNMHLDTSLDKF